MAEYGSTKESDLVGYIRHRFHYSDRGAKKLVARLEDKKKIFRIVHVKLRPPAVYFSAKQYVSLELRKELIRAQAKVQAAEARAREDGSCSLRKKKAKRYSVPAVS